MESLFIALILVMINTVTTHPPNTPVSCVLHYGLQAPPPLSFLVLFCFFFEVGERCIDVTGCTSEEEGEGSINPSSFVFLLESVSIS